MSTFCVSVCPLQCVNVANGGMSAIWSMKPGRPSETEREPAVGPESRGVETRVDSIANRRLAVCGSDGRFSASGRGPSKHFDP